MKNFLNLFVGGEVSEIEIMDKCKDESKDKTFNNTEIYIIDGLKSFKRESFFMTEFQEEEGKFKFTKIKNNNGVIDIVWTIWIYKSPLIKCRNNIFVGLADFEQGFFKPMLKQYVEFEVKHSP